MVTKRIVIADFKLYKKMRKKVGHCVTWYGFGITCPFCGRRLYRHPFKRPGKPRLANHIKWICHKTPWYWKIRRIIMIARIRKNRGITKLRRGRSKKMVNRIYRIRKSFFAPFKNLTQYSNYLLTK